MSDDRFKKQAEELYDVAHQATTSQDAIAVIEKALLELWSDAYGEGLGHGYSNGVAQG